jgi:hypothetical protein
MISFTFEPKPNNGFAKKQDGAGIELSKKMRPVKFRLLNWHLSPREIHSSIQARVHPLIANRKSVLFRSLTRNFQNQNSPLMNPEIVGKCGCGKNSLKTSWLQAQTMPARLQKAIRAFLTLT